MSKHPLERFFAQPRAVCIAQLANGLERTTWSKGIYTEKLTVPGARPAQIRAGAKKLYDVLRRNYRADLAKMGGAA